ncbi:unnamed protein product [Cylindrotheca closterium]|uniref:ATP-dependent RNA helicase n=1 Tax=Cylindrotheca closterium TaxID=2856 RepID=A0AAD2JHD2_9STRA|nr:unnamed protein product [Cylindrotheca closterium]
MTSHVLFVIFFVHTIILNLSCAFSTSNGEKRWSKLSTSTNSQKWKRGTQASNKKRKGYDLRSKRGVRTGRKKPPRWETEGDALFFVSKSDGSVPEVPGETPTEMLNNLMKMKQKLQSEKKKPGKKQPAAPAKDEDEDDDSQKKSLPPHMVWGTLSTGPILSPKLKTLYDTPTAIQTESFGPITSRQNVVIAAATGSGKSLAYLLPLMCRVSRKKFGSVMVVTPSLELAKQIKSVVDGIWTPTKDIPGSSVCIITSDLFDEGSTGFVPDEEVLNTPIIVGTAGALLKWLEFSIKSRKGRRVLENLETLVLDEADRIMQTEAMARIENDTRNGNGGTDLWERKKRLQKSDAISLFDTIASQGRSFFVKSRNHIQLICASATVGRTLRRQVMELTDATTVEMGSVLVCADSRVGKDADERRSSLLPTTIKHMYMIQEEGAEREGAAMIKEVWQVMKQLPPGPTLVFPGRTGVQLTADTLLTDCGMQHTITLRDDIRESSKALDLEKADTQHNSWEETPVFVVSEKLARGLDIPNVAYVVLAGGAPNSPAAYAHLAGRTGRVGKEGKVLTFVRDMRGAQRVVSISFKLGLAFEPLSVAGGTPDSAESKSVVEMAEELEPEAGSIHEADSPTLLREELESYTVPTLKEMLKERGEKVSGIKAELVQRLLDV